MAISDLYASPMAAAQSVMGATEQDAAIKDYLTTGGANLDPATTAWCAAFVNASLAKAGGQGTGKMNARSFMDWGQPVDQPMSGDVAVFSRGDPNGWQGHVGFYQGIGPDGKIQVLGGNQSNAVGVSGYDPSSLLGYRRAPGAAPTGEAPTAPAGGPGLGLAELYAASQAPRQEAEEAEVDRKAQDRKRREALFSGIPGMYG